CNGLCEESRPARHPSKMEKDRERARELLIWIQNAISSGRMGDPGKPGVKWFNRFLKDYDLIPRHLRKLGAVYGAVVHKAENPGRIMTIAGECLRHNQIITLLQYK